MVAELTRPRSWAGFPAGNRFVLRRGAFTRAVGGFQTRCSPEIGGGAARGRGSGSVALRCGRGGGVGRAAQAAPNVLQVGVGGRRGRQEVENDLCEPQRLVAVGEVPGGRDSSRRLPGQESCARVVCSVGDAQLHVFAVDGDRLTEHWAVRDDLRVIEAVDTAKG